MITIPMTVETNTTKIQLGVVSNTDILELKVDTKVPIIPMNLAVLGGDISLDVSTLDVDANVTIDAMYYLNQTPIPKNYGLITWNGSYLTVS